MTTELQEVYKDIVEFMSSEDVIEYWDLNQRDAFLKGGPEMERTLHFTLKGDLRSFTNECKPAVAMSLVYGSSSKLRQNVIQREMVEIPEPFKQMLHSGVLTQIKRDLSIVDTNFVFKMIGQDRMLTGYDGLMVLFELGEIDPIDPTIGTLVFKALSDKRH